MYKTHDDYQFFVYILSNRSHVPGASFTIRYQLPRKTEEGQNV